MDKCQLCGSERLVRLDSYKHEWELCRECRCGRSIKKKRYALEPFERILRPYFKKKRWAQTPNRLFKDDSMVNPTNPWDHFGSEDFIQYAKSAAEDIYKDLFEGCGIEVRDKDILEISGGSGDVVHHLLSKGAKSVSISEYNQSVVENIKERLHIPAFFYDANNQTLNEAMRSGGINPETNQFDIIMTRAIVMWCVDVEDFLKNLGTQLKSSGKIILETCIAPTLGTILWSQWSEYTYTYLYSPEFLEPIFERLGLEIIHKSRRADDTIGAFWMDRYPFERRISLYYEWKAASKMQFEPDEFRRLEFNARDVRAYRYVLQKA
ncbi:MAG: methyltransferase domain-containing protein [Wolinella sp.]